MTKNRASTADAGWYVEQSRDEAQAYEPGSFLYGPIFFEPNIVALVRPVMEKGGKTYAQHKGKILFDVCIPLPPDAFKNKQGYGDVIKPFEELVAVPSKMRPMVILSPATLNVDTALVVPSFSADKLHEDDLKDLRKGEMPDLFHLPAEPSLKVKESFLDFGRIQSVRLDPKIVTPGNRKPEESPCYLRLADAPLERLRQALARYLGAI